jgi:short-subunit dehydrogenase
VYGSAKAGLEAFTAGLTDSLHGSGVQVTIVRPGFVVGHMTEGMEPAPLSVDPDAVGRAVARAVTAGRGEVWVPRAMQGVAMAMRLTPRALWRRVPR